MYVLPTVYRVYTSWVKVGAQLWNLRLLCNSTGCNTIIQLQVTVYRIRALVSHGTTGTHQWFKESGYLAPVILEQSMSAHVIPKSYQGHFLTNFPWRLLEAVIMLTRRSRVYPEDFAEPCFQKSTWTDIGFGNGSHLKPRNDTKLVLQGQPLGFDIMWKPV